MYIKDVLLHSLSLSLSLSLDISLVQDDEVGDGTTSVTVLACELLKVGVVTSVV